MDDNPAYWSATDAKRHAQDVVTEARMPPEKRPLFRELPAAPIFPVDALGPLAPIAKAFQASTQASIAICGQSALAAATLCAQPQRDVELPGGGRKPLTGLFASVADSGERKTSVDKLALAPIRRVEDDWLQQAVGARKAYEDSLAAWEATRAHAKLQHRAKRDALQAALEHIGDKPEEPLSPMLICSDATPEALVLQLARGRPFAGIFTAEGGILIGGSAFNDEFRMRTAALLNLLWDGEAIRRHRVGTGTTFLPGRRCSTHLMMQPVVADKLFADPMLDGIGLMARVLIVAPDSTVGTRLFQEAPANTHEILKVYADRLITLLKRPYVTRPGMPTVLDPPALRFHPAARTAWIAFYNLCETDSAPDRPLAPIKAFAAKLAEHAGRLAAVLTVYHDPDAMEIPLMAMQAGITLAKHYANEMLRLHGGASVAPELRSAQRLLTWWQTQPFPSLHLAAIYQRGPTAVRDAKTARKSVEILEEHGWVGRLPAGTEIEGAPRKEAWRLRP